MSLARKRRTDRADTPALPHAVHHAYSEDEKVRPPPLHISFELTPTQRPLPRPAQSQGAHRSEIFSSWAVATLLTILAFIVRFYRIGHPDQVVFDEVHFGSFAGQYIRREYYFDVHPPLAKMLNGLAGWVVGFKGDFGFEQIGDNYTTNNVSGLAGARFPGEGGRGEGWVELSDGGEREES
jgi:dolichyl-phosphate-mannose-protein mannosyltransferase